MPSSPQVDGCEGEIARLLRRAGEGDQQARDKLFSRFYSELRSMASGRMRQERADHSWSIDDLVQEVVVRFLSGKVLEKVGDRRYFFGVAANAMRQLLIDHARKRKVRPHQSHCAALDEALDALETQQVDIFELDHALSELQRVSPSQHAVIMQRFFCGFERREIAGNMGYSQATVKKWDLQARKWLRGRLRGTRSQ